MSSTPHCNTINVGIIGYGKHLQRSHFLAEFCQEKDYFHVIGYFDPSPTSHRKFRKDFANVSPPPIVFDSLDSLLSNEAINTVFIGSPDHFHADQLEASVNAGKHVFVEKPLASCPEQLDKVKASLALAKEKGLVISTCHPRRTDHQFRYIKDRFFPTFQTEKNTGSLSPTDETLGDVISIQYRFAYHEMSTDNPKRQWKNERGLLVDHANHEIDLIHYLFPNVSEITPGCVISDSPNKYDLFGKFKYNDGCQPSYHFIGHRLLGSHRFIEQMTLLYEGGEVHLNCESGELRVEYHNSLDRRTELVQLGLPNYEAKFRQLTENFIYQVRGQDDSGRKDILPYVSDDEIKFNLCYPFFCKYWCNFDNLVPIEQSDIDYISDNNSSQPENNQSN